LSIWKNIEDCYIKINKKEFQECQNPHDIKKLIVTEGKDGCSYYEAGELNSTYRTFENEGADTVGCGDVYLAAFAIATIRGIPIEERLKYATRAATLKTTKVGTAVVTKAEVDSLE
jgi:sugar/nucleoside kinase (ribokinase family)